jgi:hypothetical protein
MLAGNGCQSPDRIIEGKYTERPSGVDNKIIQNLILTTGQDYHKVRDPKEDAPPRGLPGKYVNSLDTLLYEIFLNSDSTASYEVSSIKYVYSFEGCNMSMDCEKKKTIEKLQGQWKQKKQGTIEIKLKPD